ncbi:MAG: alpha/beta hydrolase [Jatrophihabitantaceae bacterium]
MSSTYADPRTDPARRMPGSLILGPNARMLFVRHLPPVSYPAPAVLYVHGATFPSGLSVAYPFDSRSWADELGAAGLDVWAFDFVGYGHSSRYPEQGRDPERSEPLGRAAEAAEQLECVLECVAAARGGGPVSLLAHSWGTLVAGLVAGRRPELIDRLVLFGPIARRAEPAVDVGTPGGWYPLTTEQQHARFVADVPPGHVPVLSPEHFAAWARDWLATDPNAGARNPPAVRTPVGPRLDVAAAFSGDLAYDPGAIRAPTCILRGEWDSLCTDTDARDLFDALSCAPLRRDVKLGHGTHLMHLESSRHALYREAATFLLAGDVTPYG